MVKHKGISTPGEWNRFDTEIYTFISYMQDANIDDEPRPKESIRNSRVRDGLHVSSNEACFVLAYRGNSRHDQLV